MHDEFLMGDSVDLKRTGVIMRELGRGLFILLGERAGESVLIKSASRLDSFFGLFDTTKSAFNLFMCTVDAHKILCSKYIMGGLFSSPRATNVLAIDTENVINVLTETIVNNTSKTVSSLYNLNIVTITTGPNSVINGNLNITQNIDVSKEVSGRLESSLTSDMETKVIDELILAAEQASNAQSEMLSWGDSAATNLSFIRKRLEQSVKDVLRIDNYNEIVDNTINKNDATIVINGVWNGDINVKQGIVVDIVVRNILTSIINRTNKILLESNSNIRLSQNAAASNKGLNSIVDSFTGGAKISSIISAVILCIIIMALLFIALSPAGQKSINKASNVAAARYGGGAAVSLNKIN